MSAKPSLYPRQAVLQAERTLASIESDLRRANPKTLHKCLEALADAYTYRPAGHRLDNLDRALLSYQLAVRLSSLTPSLSAKLGNVCFLRLQTVSHDHLTSAYLLRQHLTAARYYSDTAVRALENDPALYLDPDMTSVYAEALLCRGLVYDTMYQTVDAVDEDCYKPDGEPIRKACTERCLKRNDYISDCIESLEKVLSVDSSSRQNSYRSKTQHEETKTGGHESTKPRVTLRGVKKARAMMLLARAYSNVTDPSVGDVSKAITLLGSVEEILEGVEDDSDWKGVGVGMEELGQMKEDARAQRAALAASKRTTERCVVS